MSATPYQRLAQPVRFWAASTPQAPALTEAGTTWSYARLSQAIDEAVALLRKLEIRAGDRIMLVGENGLALATLILAAGELDAWAVLENARRAPQEVDATAGHCQPRRVIYVTCNSKDAAAHALRHGAMAIATRFGAISATEADRASKPEPVYVKAARQVAALIYTTGGAGAPKGVMLTHASLLHIASMMQSLRRVTPDDNVYGILPITHAMGLSSVFLGALLSGAHLIIAARFHAEACARALTDARITILQGAPAMFAKLTATINQRKLSVPQLRFIAAGGAPIDPTIKRETEALFRLVLHNGYGLTEASATCWTRIDRPHGDCSVGPVLPGTELRVLDQHGNTVADGQTGELWVRGPNVMKGYYRAPELTRRAMTADGWFNTQDLAHIDASGDVYIDA